MEYISLAVWILLGLCVVIGVLIGLIRGLTKSLVRLIWFVGSFAVVLIFSNIITPFLLNLNVSFLGMEFQGIPVTSIKETVQNMVVANAGLPLEQVEPTVAYAFNVARMLLGGIVCFLLFSVVQIITIPLYYILNAILKVGKKGKKRRLLGGVTGLVSGVMVFIMILMPVTGYVSVAKNVLEKVDMSENAEMQQSADMVNEVCDRYSENGIVKLFKSIGIEKLQIEMFKGVTTVVFDDGEKVSLVTESENAGDIFNSIKYVKEIDFNGIMNGSATIDRENITSAVTFVLNSGVVRQGVTVAKPMILTKAQEAIENSAYSEHKDMLMKAVDEVLTGIVKLDAPGIKDSINAISDIIETIPAVKENVENVEFALVGKSCDDIVRLQLLSADSINGFIGILSDVAIEQYSKEELIVNAFTKIKGGFNEGVESYEPEFSALDKLMTVVPLVKDGFSETTDLVSIGRIIDETFAAPTKVINEELITGVVSDAINNYADLVIPEGHMLEEVVGEFQKKIKEGGLTYETELGVVSKLVSLKSVLGDNIDLSGETGIKIGATLDESLAMGSKIITKDLINELIKKALTSVSKNTKQEPLKKVIDGSIDKINNSITSYKAEFSAISELINIQNELDGKIDISANGVLIGTSIDNALSKGSVIINNELINTFILSVIDNTFADLPLDSVFHSSVSGIRSAFKENKITSYKTEFEAIAKLLSIKDEVESPEFKFDTGASLIGAKIDETIAMNANVASKTIINGFIKAIMDNSFTMPDGYGNIETIKGRLDNDFSYKTEFGYIEKLLKIASSPEIGNISLDNINKKDSEGMTIGEHLDSIASSVLIGDMGINAIDNALVSYISLNAEFAKITDEISKNFVEIKKNMKVGINPDGTITYVEVTGDFDALVSAMTGKDKITAPDSGFTSSVAESYENTLSQLQKTMIMGKNGTRALASYVAEKVKEVVLAKKTGYKPVDDKIDEFAGSIQNYINYLERKVDLDKEEQYNSATDKFAHSTDNFVTNITYPADALIEGTVKINKPFSTVIKAIEEIIAIP